MSTKNNERSYKKYYIDHPTSINHHQKYLVPMQNQYSILNQPRNPYAALDNFSFDLTLNHNNMNLKSASRLAPLQNQSLNLQVLEWERKNIQKENEYKIMKSEVRDLSRLVKLKEMEEELTKISKRKEKPSDRSIIMPYPMMMPFMGGMGMGGHCCSCSCSCRCSCSNKCNCQEDHRQSKDHKTFQKYRPMMIQNCAVQTDPQPIINATQPTQIKKSSIPRIPTQKSVIAVEPIKRQPPKKKKNLLRRLRVVCYAIYFCIYFKWFSFQFSINRYTRFRGKYLNDQSQTLTSQLKQIYDQLLGIDIISLVKNASSKVSEPKVTHQNFQIKSLLKAEAISKFNKIGNLTYLSSDYQTLYLRCGQFILSLLDSVESLLIDWDWGQVAEGLGVGSINQTFVIDNAFLPHQIYLLIFHDGKGYARLGPEEERMLMAIKVLVKLLIFNVCLQLDNNKEWFEINEQVIENEKNMDEIFIFLQISTKILFIICQNLYEKAIINKDTNYGQVDEKFKIQPSNPLIYSHSIKKRRQLFKNQDVRDSNLLIYGIDKLDEVNNIILMSFFQKMEKRIISKIGKSMSSIVGKVKQYNRQKYAQIWEETISNEYLVLRGLKKIMKPNKFYPFASSSVLASKKNVSSKNLTKKTINQGSINSFNTKVSIQNMLQRASYK